MLTIQHCKESLSRAYITAVVGRSLNNLQWGYEYDYGVDGSVKTLVRQGQRIMPTGQGFDFQSKTTVNWAQDGADIVYDLEAKAFNDLANRAQTNALPFLLILLCLHENEANWLEVSPAELILRHCAYWYKLDSTPTTNTDTHRIRIPSANVFTPEAVRGILEDIRTGVMLP